VVFLDTEAAGYQTMHQQKDIPYCFGKHYCQNHSDLTIWLKPIQINDFLDATPKP